MTVAHSLWRLWHNACRLICRWHVAYLANPGGDESEDEDADDRDEGEDDEDDDSKRPSSDDPDEMEDEERAPGGHRHMDDDDDPRDDEDAGGGDTGGGKEGYEGMRLGYEGIRNCRVACSTRIMSLLRYFCLAVINPLLLEAMFNPANQSLNAQMDAGTYPVAVADLLCGDVMTYLHDVQRHSQLLSVQDLYVTLRDKSMSAGMTEDQADAYCRVLWAKIKGGVIRQTVDENLDEQQQVLTYLSAGYALEDIEALVGLR